MEIFQRIFLKSKIIVINSDWRHYMLIAYLAGALVIILTCLPNFRMVNQWLLK